METKTSIVLMIFITTASGMIVNQEYRNSNNYYHDKKDVQYQTTPITTYLTRDNHKYQEKEYENVQHNYEFKYAVNDEKTGDIKSHYEIRDGDNVKGMYTLLDADGYKRIVEYTADSKNGFQATVHRQRVNQIDQQHAKYTNDHESRNHHIIYKPTVPSVEKYMPIERYKSHNFESNTIKSNYISDLANRNNAPGSENNYLTIPELKYASVPEVKYVPAVPKHKYVTEAPEIKYATTAPIYEHVTNNLKYKYANEAPHYENDVTQHKYTARIPKYEYVTETPQYKYTTEPTQYEYATEAPHYKYVTQKPTSQYVTVPYRYVTASSVERKPPKEVRPSYNSYNALEAKQFKPSHEYNSGYHKHEFIYGH